MTTTPREHGRLFTGEMVRAILAGRKTQTQRPLRPQPTSWGYEIKTGKHGDGYLTPGGFVPMGEYWSTRRPYGILVGDTIVVRETWRAHMGVPKAKIEYRAGGEMLIGRDDWQWAPYCAWLADKTLSDVDRWRSSMSMPRWAARTLLPVTAKREERLQDITPEDARAEGAYWASGWRWPGLTARFDEPEQAFAAGWDSMYGKKPGQRLAQNPWVQVCEWKPLKGAKT